MTNKRFEKILFLLLAISATPAVAADRGEVAITLTYTHASERVSPDPHPRAWSRQVLSLILKGNRTVASHSSQGRRGVRYFGRQGQGEQNDLGEEGQNFAWTVLGSGQLQGKQRWGRDAIMTITISTDSSDACSADFRIAFLNGQKIYHAQMRSRPGVIGTYTNFRVEKYTCLVSRQ